MSLQHEGQDVNEKVDLTESADTASTSQVEPDLHKLRLNEESQEQKRCTCASRNHEHSPDSSPKCDSPSQSIPTLEDGDIHEFTCPLSDAGSNSINPVPLEGGDSESEEFHDAEPLLLDDLVDEEVLKEEEATLSEDELVARLEKAKAYKKEGNYEFGEMNFRESILTYTKGLLICPLRDKDFRSILYANRSAAKIKLGRKELAIEDCTKSLENNPEYIRVLLRRAKLYEESEKLEDALADFQKVYELNPSDRDAWNAIQRLPGEIHEKNEKLKAEMMDKLKDLGNMILRPFGLSTENFKMQQDPNSGGYSINFNK